MMAGYLSTAIDEIEGIGQQTTATLRDQEIKTFADLLNIDAEVLGNRTPGISAQRVATWQNAARLMRVDELDNQLAEALVEKGITSLAQLGDCGLRTIELAVRAAVDARRIAKVPSLYKLAALQREAAKLAGTGMIQGQITDQETGRVLDGLSVTAGHESTKTDEQGMFELLRVPEGEAAITFRKSGSVPITVPIDIKRNTLIRLKMGVTLREAPAEQQLGRESGRFVAGKGTVLQTKKIRLADVVDQSYLKVSKIDDSQARLLVMRPGQAGHVLYAQHVLVPLAMLPDGAAVDSILYYKSGALLLTRFNTRTLAARLVRLSLGGRYRVRPADRS